MPFTPRRSDVGFEVDRGITPRNHLADKVSPPGIGVKAFLDNRPHLRLLERIDSHATQELHQLDRVLAVALGNQVPALVALASSRGLTAIPFRTRPSFPIT